MRIHRCVRPGTPRRARTRPRSVVVGDERIAIRQPRAERRELVEAGRDLRLQYVVRVAIEVRVGEGGTLPVGSNSGDPCRPRSSRRTATRSDAARPGAPRSRTHRPGFDQPCTSGAREPREESLGEIGTGTHSSTERTMEPQAGGARDHERRRHVLRARDAAARNVSGNPRAGSRRMRGPEGVGPGTDPSGPSPRGPARRSVARARTPPGPRTSRSRPSGRCRTRSPCAWRVS